jgi:hypothetical protein
VKKKQVEQEQRPEFKIHIVHYEDQEITRHADPEDKWGADSYRLSHRIEGYEVSTSWWDFVLPTHPNNEPLHLVYALYNTGDSFHTVDNKICFLFLSPHNEDAVKVLRELEKNAKEKPEDFHPIVVELPVSKQTVTIGTSDWKGYFESLNGFEIHTLFPATDRYS